MGRRKAANSNMLEFLPAARYEHAGLHVHFVLPSFPEKRLQEAYTGQKSTETWVRGHAHMTSALRGREGVGQFLTKGREVAWIWY